MKTELVNNILEILSSIDIDNVAALRLIKLMTLVVGGGEHIIICKSEWITENQYQQSDIHPCKTVSLHTGANIRFSMIRHQSSTSSSLQTLLIITALISIVGAELVSLSAYLRWGKITRHDTPQTF